MSKTNSLKFLKFALRNKVLKFGDFTTKAGRQSPYFFNTGVISSGESIDCLSRFYAQSIKDSGIEFDMLYGPAYKGIPLATATAMKLKPMMDKDIPFAFNRKEAKNHGEGGNIIGAPLKGRVLVIDDVISAGTSVTESIKIIKDNGAEFAGVSISFDRQERKTDNSFCNSAAQEIEEIFEVPVLSIATFMDLINLIEDNPENAEWLEKIRAYHAKYGA